MAKITATWKRVKFGELAKCVNDRVDDPKAAGVDRYVGLEHLDPESLAIRRWGTPDEVQSTKLRFKSGDIIFGKRRAYQRKVAVADFDGICSAHAMVLRAKPMVLPEFLSFFMQSDIFMERAVAISVGSLSPTINWKTLAAEEFALPPLEEQRPIAEAARASALLHESLRVAISTAWRLYDSLLSQSFVCDEPGPGVAPSEWAKEGWSIERLELVADPDAPISYGIVQPGLSTPDGVPTATSNNLNVGFADSIHLTDPTIEAAYARSRIRGGDILVTVKGFGTGNIGRVPQHFSGNITRDVARIRLLRSEDAAYLMHLWRCRAFERYWRAVSVGTTRPELSIGKLRAMEIPWPSETTRSLIVERLDILKAAATAQEERLRQALATHSALLRATLARSCARGSS